ncbi:MAG: Lrp/AsnC ligand binding domain-containing protein [Candidatus Nezhaarchaeales archaeon]
MVIAGHRYAERGAGKITLAAVVDEEGLSRGMKHLIESLPQPEYAIFGEPGGASSVTIGYKGSVSVRVKLKTRSGHTATSWLYDNAAEKGYELWLLLREELSKYVVQGSYYKSLTWCLTSVKSGVIKCFTIETGAVEAITLVVVDPSTSSEGVVSSISKLTGVRRVYEVTGDFDAVALISTGDVAAMNKCIDQIRSIPGVRSTKTMVVLRSYA